MMVTGGSTVNANDGAILAGFTADVEFDVVDNFGGLTSAHGCTNDPAGHLTEADSITA